MAASLTMYLLWLFVTVVALWIVIFGGTDKGTRYPRRSERDPKHIVAKR